MDAHSECIQYNSKSSKTGESKYMKSKGGDLQDGRGVRRGGHLSPHKHIKNTCTCRTHLQNNY